MPMDRLLAVEESAAPPAKSKRENMSPSDSLPVNAWTALQWAQDLSALRRNSGSSRSARTVEALQRRRGREKLHARHSRIKSSLANAHATRNAQALRSARALGGTIREFGRGVVPLERARHAADAHLERARSWALDMTHTHRHAQPFEGYEASKIATRVERNFSNPRNPQLGVNFS